MHKRIKEIIYQYVNDFDIDNLSDEERVKYAQSLINSLISTNTLEKGLISNVLGADIKWGYGGTNDSVVEIVYNGFGIVKDLKKARKKDIGIRMPKGISISWDEFDRSIKLSWDEVESAFGYRIIRDFNTQIEKTILDGSSGFNNNDGKLTLVDNVGDDHVHTYVIVAISSNDNEKYDVSFPKEGKAFHKASVPTNLKASNNTLNRAIEISWDKSPYAVAYTIKRDGSIIVANHKSTSYIDEVRDDKEHKYQVKSEGSIDSADSRYTNPKVGKGYSSTTPPENTKASVNKLKESVELTWDKIENAKSYRIERDGEVVKSNHKSELFIDKVGDNKNHTYRVMSEGVVEDANSVYSSEFVGRGYSIAKQPKPSASYNKRELSVLISWKQADYASSYVIRRDGEILSEVESTSYIDKVGDSKEHFYDVMSKGVVDGAESDYSETVIGKGYRKAKKPFNVYATSNVLEKAVRIRWDSTEDYVYSIKRDDKIIISKLSGNEFIDNVGDGNSHTYRVMSEGEVLLANSQWSSAVNGRGYVKAQPVKNFHATYDKYEGEIVLTWDKSKDAVGYTIKKDEKILIIKYEDTTYTDTVNDSEEHTYEIKSNGIVGQADSDFSSQVLGRSK